MANTYAASTFVVDTSTNVAGLVALKGSAIASTDNICISGIACPTLTIESSIACNSLNIGFAAINGGSGGCGQLVVNDNVVITMTSAGKWLLRRGSAWSMNGTLRTVGTSNGAPDQTYAQLHADNTTVYVDGESGAQWQWVPSLRGLICDVTATTNTTSITCTTDPRLTGLFIGALITIQKRADGTSPTVRTVTAITATSVSFTGAVSVDSTYSVYRAIAGTEKVYTCSGGNIIFGDGTSAAWNNNGGAIPANGLVVAQNGITLTASTAAGCRWDNVSGTVDFNHVDMARQLPSAQSWGSHVVSSAKGNLHSCSWHHSLGYGFYITSGCSDWVLSGTVNTYANAGVGFYVTHGCSGWVLSGTVNTYANASYGFGVASGCSDWLLSGTVNIYANASYGFSVASGCSDWLLSGTVNTYANASYGFSVTSGCSDWRVLSSPRLGGNSNNTIFVNSSGGFAASREQTGIAGVFAWRCNEETSAVGFADGDSVRLPTQDAYHESAQVWIPGLAAYGVPTITVTLNGATASTQFRRSGDYGRSWTAWADVPIAGNLTADTPDSGGEYVQFRVAKSDAGAGVPDHGGVSVVCTFVDNFVFDVTQTPPMAAVTSAGSVIGCRFIRGMGFR